MEDDVVVVSEAPTRNAETPRTFQIRPIRPQQSYQLIVVCQKFLFEGAVRPKGLIVVYSFNNRDGQRWQQSAQRRTRHEIETPPANERTISRKLADVLRNERSVKDREGINKGKASASTIEFAEGHGRSRAANGERDNSSWKGMAEAAPRTANAYQTPSRTIHTWHKSEDKKTSKNISKSGSRDGDDTPSERSRARRRRESQHCNRSRSSRKAIAKLCARSLRGLAVGRSKFQKFQILKGCEAKTSIGTYEDHTESPETYVLHGRALSLVGTDSTCESGTERNSVIQIIAENKRQVPKIMQFVIEISFCGSAVNI